MALKQITNITDDIDGSEGARTVKLSFEGQEVEIDLTDKHISDLTQSLALYMQKGRQVARSTGKRNTSRPSSDNEAAKIRQWATDQGREVPARGRIPKALVEAYNAAH